ncbi:uncharacterized protein EAE98_004219 [Botrytis deweyae]|uniref:Sulfurtransferase n=1 Tax=Botrytis deweyae TaxID=2478750 RepID=A0ABQ7IQA2_9HELO|nr:uncharacterized protein EAE98_004219 [Botrytis deweyae]KAF7931483.1 hypothetical protein EAE98_004219 [Botrytis deweyae]
MSTPRVSRTLARALQTRMGASSVKCYSTSQLSTSRRKNFSIRVREGGLMNAGIFGRESARGSRYVGRSYSQESETKSKYYTFEDMQKLASAPHPDTHIIDVRTPLEVQQTGRIPGAVNISITTDPDAFSISEEEFEDRFGFERPGKEVECVFYCKAGVRSRAAAQIAKGNGWRKVGEFEGSWGEWSGKGGEVER